jgi:hypothetical protein
MIVQAKRWNFQTMKEHIDSNWKRRNAVEWKDMKEMRSKPDIRLMIYDLVR